MKGKKTGGKQKGYKAPATVNKEQARDALRLLVLAEMAPMTQAQIEHAKGVSYMVLRHEDGTFTRATDVHQLDAACAAGSTAFRIFTQAPNVQAFTDLMNRALDKPKEQPQEVAVTGQLDIVSILRARRERRKP